MSTKKGRIVCWTEGNRWGVRHSHSQGKRWHRETVKREGEIRVKKSDREKKATGKKVDTHVCCKFSYV